MKRKRRKTTRANNLEAIHEEEAVVVAVAEGVVEPVEAA